MKRVLALVSTLALFSCATPPLTKEQTLVNRAVDAMGGAERLAAVRSVAAKGTTKQWEPEQSDVPGGEMRFANETTFDVVQDRGQRASRTDIERRFAYPAPRTFKFTEVVTPDAGYVLGVDTNGRNAQSQKMTPPAHSMSGARLATTQRESLRATTTGLLLQMHANPAQVRPALDVVAGGRSYPAVAYGPFTVAFDPQTGLPVRVRTLDYDNVWGDVNYDLVFSDWRSYDGLRVPMNRKYELNGRLIQESQLTDFRANVPVDAARFEVPQDLRADAAKPAGGNVPYQWVIRRQFIGTYLDSDNVSYDTRASQPGLRLQEIAPGVHHVVGGSHNSLLVEMADHLVMVDAPVSDAQSIWVVNQAKARFPGKPIRWLVLTHHHMDHAGGVRGVLAEGAVLVVGQGAREHYRKVLAAPMTRNPDMKPVDFSGVQILEVPESHVMRDASGRQVVAYAILDNPHAKGMLMAYVPHAKLGFVTDLWTPGLPLPDKANPALTSVVNTVKRAGIDPERFAGGHGSTAAYDGLAKLAGN
ncbi:MAG TPA: MBL fold metallo-hydrolase [Burkholderiales bacterium]|nr:MBL fold metallo-hydrolase [Burkholderiales bacterium]